MKEYAIYDKNETLVFLGGVLKACEYLGMTKASFQSEVCRIKKGIIKNTRGYVVIAVPIEE